jgi:hypothetical protein
VKRRILLLFLAAHFAPADALDDTVSQWSKSISSHLAVDEVAHVTWKEAGVMDASSSVYVARAKAQLARALQRRAKEPKPIEITATFSQNLKDYLLIAEIHRENESLVEIATLPRMTAPAAPTAALRLERKLLWEQETPILDVVVNIGADTGVDGNAMLVLDTTGITLYEMRDSKWQKAAAAAFDVPPVRDPRGHLIVMENSVVAEVPGAACKGAWKPMLTIECQPGSRFTTGRNTIEEAGWPPYFTHAEIGGEHVIAAADGRTYIYDAGRKRLSASDLWGDFAAISPACAAPEIVGADLVQNTLALFDLANHDPVRVSDSVEMPGTIVAMWPQGKFALAVVQNKNANRYEAYRVGVDCGR